MRFYWKATPDSRDHTGVKCKMLRPVAFPADNFDVYDLCTPAVQRKLKVWRDKHADASNPAKRARIEGPEATAAGAGTTTSTEDDELAAALRMSMGEDTSASTSVVPAGAGSAVEDRPVGLHLPEEFRGLYGKLHACNPGPVWALHVLLFSVA
jgi:ubiquitin carboxyl-terminal hydrolase 14